MSGSAVIWIIIIALVVLALIVVAMIVALSRRGSGVEAQRDQARELRERAEADRVQVQRHEAEAAKLDAQARLAQAEADARAADAAELQVQARERAEYAGGSRAELDQQFRKADEIDPDVHSDGGSDVPADDPRP